MVFLHPLILTLLYLLQEARFIKFGSKSSYELPFTMVRSGMDPTEFGLTSYRAICLPSNHRESKSSITERPSL